MKKSYIASSVAAALTVLSVSMPISADTVTLGTVTADALNVRSKPTTDSVILSQVPNGGTVYVTDILDGWHKITLNGFEAYVSADYVTLGETVEIQIPTPNLNLPPDVPSYVDSQIPGEMLVEAAKQFIGTPYVYGGMSPAGFDCSGFVKYCFALMGVDVKRVAKDQATCGVEVGTAAMQPGDILCFASSIGGSYIGHTGIYVGNGYFIHSPQTGRTVEVTSLNQTSYGKRIVNVRRMF